jgi:hypothetical protein
MKRLFIGLQTTGNESPQTVSGIIGLGSFWQHVRLWLDIA